ncbi:MAG: aldose epimerase family protein [Planctomycetota bacterium]
MSTTPLLHVALILAASAALISCVSKPVVGPLAEEPVRTGTFGETSDGRQAHLYVLRNARGTEAHVTDFGATLVRMLVPDASGEFADVVLGFDDVSGYESDANQYFGCTAGRVANRIAGGRFELNGRTYELATNNDANHLHGGVRGFGQHLWKAEVNAFGAEVRFERISPDGEEGYPGRVAAAVTYALTEDDELIVRYEATTDAPTPVNLTHHSYFNLAGHGSPTVLDHVLRIGADRYTPTDAGLIPTGEVAGVEGTALDFRVPTSIGARVDDLDGTPAKGYDHNYAVRDAALPANFEAAITAGPVAVLKDPGSGRVLELYSDQPGLQFYSGNFLFGQAGKGGATYALRSACCLETQGYPDAVNHPSFPSVILLPGQVYRQVTVHRFLSE